MAVTVIMAVYVALRLPSTVTSCNICPYFASYIGFPQVVAPFAPRILSYGQGRDLYGTLALLGPNVLPNKSPWTCQGIMLQGVTVSFL